MLLNGELLDLKPEYIAKLENGIMITGFSDGTAMDSDGNRYKLIAEFDEDDNIVYERWEIK